MTENKIPEAEPLHLPMVPGSIRDAVLAEADRVNIFVQSLTTDQWKQPSAAKDWSIGDVVAHVNLALSLYNRLLGAVASGKGSGSVWKAMGRLTNSVMPAASPALNAINSAIPRMLDRALAPEVLKGQLAAGTRTLRSKLLEVESTDFTQPVHYRGRPWPLSFFLAAATNELAIHGWDMASRLDPSAHLGAEARAVLPWFYWSGTPFMLQMPKETRGTVQVVLTYPDAELWWTLSDDGIDQGSGAASGDPTATINGMSGVFSLALAGRIAPEDAFRTTSLERTGNEDLAATFLRSWKVL